MSEKKDKNTSEAPAADKQMAAEHLRAGPLPAFVTLEWFKRQLGVFSVKQRNALAEKFSTLFQHWRGDEDEGEFYDKALADLALPGFVSVYLSAKTKKPPFIVQRFMAAGMGRKKHEGSPMLETLAAIRKRDKLDDLAELAFFAALFESETDLRTLSIAGCSAGDMLEPFLESFAEKNELVMQVSYEHDRRNIAERWQSALKSARAIFDETGVDAPDDSAFAELQSGVERLRRIAGDYVKLTRRKRQEEYRIRRDGTVKALSPFGGKAAEGDGAKDAAAKDAAVENAAATAALHEKLAALPAQLPEGAHWHVFGEKPFYMALAEVVAALVKEEHLRRQLEEATAAGDSSRVAELSQQGKELAGERDALAKQALEAFESANASAPPVPQKPAQWQPPAEAAGETAEHFQGAWDKTTKSITAYIDAGGDEPDTIIADELAKALAQLRELHVGYGQASEREAREDEKLKLAEIGGRLRALAPAAGDDKDEDRGDVSETVQALFARLDNLCDPAKPLRTRINWPQLDETVDALCGMLDDMNKVQARVKTLAQGDDDDAAAAAAGEADKLKPRRDVLAQRALDALRGKSLPPLPDFGKMPSAPAAPVDEDADEDDDAPGQTEEQRAARRAARRQNAYRRQVDSTVAGYLRLGEFDIAAMLAECGEATADGVQLAYSARVLDWLARPENLLAAEVESFEQDIGDAGKVALFAAALYAAVFSPGARLLFRADGIFSGCCAADERLENIRRQVEALDTYVLTVDEFLQNAPVDEGDESARERLQTWYHDKKSKKIKYAPATHMWHRWMNDSGLFGEAIVALLKQQPRLAAAMLEQADKDGVKSMAEAAIDAENAKIEAGARDQLVALFEEGIEHLRAAAAELARSSAADKDTLCQRLRGALAAFEARQPDELHAAAGEQCLRRGLSFFEAPLIHQIAAAAAIPAGVCMAKVPNTWHNGDGQLIDYHRRIIRRAWKALQDWPGTPQQQCSQRLFEGAMLSVQMLLPLVADEGLRAAMQTRYEVRLVKLRAELEGEIDALREKIAELPASDDVAAALALLDAIVPARLPSQEAIDGGKIQIHDFPQAKKVLKKLALKLFEGRDDDDEDDEEDEE